MDNMKERNYIYLDFDYKYNSNVVNALLYILFLDLILKYLYHCYFFFDKNYFYYHLLVVEMHDYIIIIILIFS